jgi:hypothetical protein
MKNIAKIIGIAGLLLTLVSCNSKPYTTKTEIPVNNPFTSTVTETEIKVGFKKDIKGKYYSYHSNKAQTEINETGYLSYYEITDTEIIKQEIYEGRETTTKGTINRITDMIAYIRVGFASTDSLAIFDGEYMFVEWYSDRSNYWSCFKRV